MSSTNSGRGTGHQAGGGTLAEMLSLDEVIEQNHRTDTETQRKEMANKSLNLDGPAARRLGGKRNQLRLSNRRLTGGTTVEGAEKNVDNNGPKRKLSYRMARGREQAVTAPPVQRSPR